MLIKLIHYGCIYCSFYRMGLVVLNEPTGTTFFDKVSAQTIHGEIIFFNKFHIVGIFARGFH